MQARHLLFAGLLGVTSTADAVRGPDVHVIRQGRGDVLVVREKDGAKRPTAHFEDSTHKPVRIGQRLRPQFYAPRTFVAAPRGFAPARGTRRWVGYGGDLLLVNVRDGRVEHVLPGGRHREKRTQAAR